jgi:hypothetical protein
VQQSAAAMIGRYPKIAKKNEAACITAVVAPWQAGTYTGATIDPMLRTFFFWCLSLLGIYLPGRVRVAVMPQHTIDAEKFLQGARAMHWHGKPLLDNLCIFQSRDRDETQAWLHKVDFRVDYPARAGGQLDTRLNGVYLPGMYLGYETGQEFIAHLACECTIRS